MRYRVHIGTAPNVEHKRTGDVLAALYMAENYIERGERVRITDMGREVNVNDLRMGLRVSGAVVPYGSDSVA